MTSTSGSKAVNLVKAIEKNVKELNKVFELFESSFWNIPESKLQRMQISSSNGEEEVLTPSLKPEQVEKSLDKETSNEMNDITSQVIFWKKKFI